jgi:hypothetical protein
MTAVTHKNAQAGSDRSFFLAMAGAIAITVAVGFTVSLARPQTAFASAPLHVHIHGAVFSLWILVYLIQNILVVRGSIALHRALGMFAAGLAVVMVALGILTTVLALKLHRVPPFFPPGVFLVLDITSVMTFAGLTFAAIALRRDPAWHKRLMLCGTIMVMSPALGRLLPMPLLGPWGSWAVSGTMLLYVLVAALYDRGTRGRIHPAYAWGTGAIVATQLAIAGLSFTPPILAIAARLQG